MMVILMLMQTLLNFCIIFFGLVSYVSQSQIKLLGLKTGDTVEGNVRPPKSGEKYFPLIKVEKINGRHPNIVRDRVPFEHLTPLFPYQKWF